MHQLSVPDDPDQWGVDHSYSIAHSVEVMAKIKGVGRGKKYNLMAQVIPIYGFGILLYILYIIYKLTCKGKTNKSADYTTASRANTQNTIINDYELARLQERLLQTERMMERIVSGKGHCSGRRRKSKTTTSKKEEKLLKELRQITQLIQEGRLEAASPEMEAEEVPYDADWEGYPEETYPEYEDTSDRPRFKMKLEGQISQPTAEALAERMEQEEEEIMARKLSIVHEEDEDEEEREVEEDEDDEDDDDDVDGEDEERAEGIEEEAEEIVQEEEEEEEAEAEKRQLLSLPPPTAERKQERLGLEVSKELQHRSGGKKQISFSDHRDVFHYPKEETYEEEEEEKEDETEEEDEGTEVEEEEEEEEGDDEDPVMEAESLQFSCEGSSNPEEDAEEDAEEYALMSALVEDDIPIRPDTAKDVGVSGLRMRNRRET